MMHEMRGSMGDTAKRARKDAKNIAVLRDEVDAIEKEIAALRAEHTEKLDRLHKARLFASQGFYDKATKTTYVVDSDPYGHRWRYTTWDDSRSADVYLNAHNRTTYGVNVNKRRFDSWQQVFQGGKFLGAEYTLEEAQNLAVDWITMGFNED